MAGEVKPTDDSRCPEHNALLQLKDLRVSTSPKDMDGDSHTSSKSTESYNLLCEDDPDDFISVEIPMDAVTTDSDAPPLELTEIKKKGKFLESLRRNHTSSGDTHKTVITGRRRSGGINMGSSDRGSSRRGGRGRGSGRSVSPHKVSVDWTDTGGEELKDGERRTRSSEPMRHNSHSSYEDEVNMRPRANDFMPGQDSTGHTSRGQNSHAGSHGGEDRQPGRSGGQDHTFSTATGHDASHHHQHLVESSQGVSMNEEEELRGMTAGIAGLTASTSQLHQREPSPVFDPSLRSDMLMSLHSGGGDPEMSVQQSLHIGVAAGDLQVAKIKLLSDEQMAKDASRARIDSVESDHREFEDEDVESAAWCEHQKHIFVLSLSGKPVYSRYGKEDKLVNLFGIMQALVSFVQDDRDNLRSVVAGSHRFVFVCRGPLVLVSVAQSRQSETQLAIQLNYVYNQILSVLTYTQLSQIFEKSPGYDLRYLLQGSEKFVDNILNMIDSDPSFIIGGIRCLYMSVALRHIITTTLLQCRSKDVLFAVVVASNQVVTYIKPRDHNLVPIDIHVILNLVDASTSFRSAESWTPICLPKFNDTGFLHAHVSYLQSESPACMLLISTNKEMFFDLQQCQQKIVEKLERQGCISLIADAVRESNYNIDSLRSPEIRHFLYKSRKTLGVTSPKLPSIYALKQDKQRLYSQYMFMHERLHSTSWPTKILYHVGNKEALLGWRTANFDLYIVYDPLISKAQAITLGNKLIKWIIRDEDKLIITSSHTF